MPRAYDLPSHSYLALTMVPVIWSMYGNTTHIGNQLVRIITLTSLLFQGTYISRPVFTVGHKEHRWENDDYFFLQWYALNLESSSEEWCFLVGTWYPLTHLISPFFFFSQVVTLSTIGFLNQVLESNQE